jgi:hypothetical protein
VTWVIYRPTCYNIRFLNIPVLQIHFMTLARQGATTFILHFITFMIGNAHYSGSQFSFFVVSKFHRSSRWWHPTNSDRVTRTFLSFTDTDDCLQLFVSWYSHVISLFPQIPLCIRGCIAWSPGWCDVVLHITTILAIYISNGFSLSHDERNHIISCICVG